MLLFIWYWTCIIAVSRYYNLRFCSLRNGQRSLSISRKSNTCLHRHFQLLTLQLNVFVYFSTRLAQVPVVCRSIKFLTVVSAIPFSASTVRNAWCPLSKSAQVSALSGFWEVILDARHENVVKRQQPREGIVCDDFWTWICKKVRRLPLVDVEADCSDMSTFQSPVIMANG